MLRLAFCSICYALISPSAAASLIDEYIQSRTGSFSSAAQAANGSAPLESRREIIARFPCLQAAKDFWYSDIYQNEIRPMRDGIATFEVIALGTPPMPAYAGGD